MIFSIAAAVFVYIGRRMYNLCNINKTDFNPSDGKLRIYFADGDQAEIQDPNQIEQFHSAIDQFVLEPPPTRPEPIPEPTGTAPPANDPDPESEDDPGDDNSDDGNNDPGTGDETDDEPSELELAGLPADVAALLHAGGIDTVEAVLTHPDLTQVEGIGANRKDKILKILKT